MHVHACSGLKGLHDAREIEVRRGLSSACHSEVRKRANPQHNLPPLEGIGYLPALPKL